MGREKLRTGRVCDPISDVHRKSGRSKPRHLVKTVSSMTLRPPQELSTKHLRQPAQTEAEAAGLPVSPNDGVVGQSGLTMAAEEERLLVAGAIDEMFYRHQCLSLPTDADAAQHYLAHGWRMGWDPSPDFSTNLYLERSPDVRAAGINPFYHYLRHGRTEGRVANAHAAEMADAIGAEFDHDFYLRNHPELVGNGVDPVLHYLAHGWRMGWDPSPDFSTNLYLERSPDVRAAGINPFYHYLRHGRTEGRVANAHAAEMADAIGAEFDHDFYLRNHPMRRHRQGQQTCSARGYPSTVTRRVSYAILNMHSHRTSSCRAPAIRTVALQLCRVAGWKHGRWRQWRLS